MVPVRDYRFRKNCAFDAFLSWRLGTCNSSHCLILLFGIAWKEPLIHCRCSTFIFSVNCCVQCSLDHLGHFPRRFWWFSWPLRKVVVFRDWLQVIRTMSLRPQVNRSCFTEPSSLVTFRYYRLVAVAAVFSLLFSWFCINLMHEQSVLLHVYAQILVQLFLKSTHRVWCNLQKVLAIRSQHNPLRHGAPDYLGIGL